MTIEKPYFKIPFISERQKLVKVDHFYKMNTQPEIRRLPRQTVEVTPKLLWCRRQPTDVSRQTFFVSVSSTNIAEALMQISEQLKPWQSVIQIFPTFAPIRRNIHRFQ